MPGNPKWLLTAIQRRFPKVMRLVDAKDDLEVEVTPKDEREGKRKDIRACALVVGGCRQEKLDGLVASIACSYLIRGDTATRYCNSQPVQREMVSFDRGGRFFPGLYLLKRPPKSHKLGVKHHHFAKRHNPKKSTRARAHTTEGVRPKFLA